MLSEQSGSSSEFNHRRIVRQQPSCDRRRAARSHASYLEAGGIMRGLRGEAAAPVTGELCEGTYTEPAQRAGGLEQKSSRHSSVE